LKGKWKYLEHDWVAEAGSYVFEPPGEIHTLVVPEGVDEMVSYMQMLFNRIIIYYILLYSLMLTILHALSTN
jgi:outer membrane protease